MNDSQDQIMEDEPAADTDTHVLPVSEDESRVLELYETLQQLRLEIAMINAQKAHGNDVDMNLSESLLENARSELLETRGLYMLRNQVIESTMTANPILRAVHGSVDASPIEQDLLPYITKRDELAAAVAKSAAEKNRIRQDITTARVDAMRASQANVELAAEVVRLAEQVRTKKKGHRTDPELRAGMEELEASVKASRQRWRVLKSLASGVVAGSGVDWARDEELRDVVLDSDDEEED